RTSDLKLRPEIPVPEESHRELPHLAPAVAGIATVAGVVESGRLPTPRVDSTDDALAAQRSQQLTVQQQFQIIGVLIKLYVLMENLKSSGSSTSPMALGEEMIAKTVCRHAVKANDPLRYPEIEKLIRDLLECDLPYCCPHGRPTMIQISLTELEKKFGRKI